MKRVGELVGALAERQRLARARRYKAASQYPPDRFLEYHAWLNGRRFAPLNAVRLLRDKFARHPQHKAAAFELALKSYGRSRDGQVVSALASFAFTVITPAAKDYLAGLARHRNPDWRFRVILESKLFPSAAVHFEEDLRRLASERERDAYVRRNAVAVLGDFEDRGVLKKRE